MLVKQIINEMWPTMWPLIVFVSVVAISLRLAFLKGNSKFILHKELMALILVSHSVIKETFLLGVLMISTQNGKFSIKIADKSPNFVL